MGVAIAVEAPRPSSLHVAEHLPLLGWFAFLRSASSWAEVLDQIPRVAEWAPVAPYLQVGQALLLPLSALFLLQYGVRSILAIRRRPRWLRWLPFALVSIWLLALAGSSRSLSDLSDGLVRVSVLTRYLLYMPGLALSSLAAVLLCPALRGLGTLGLKRNCLAIGVAFGFKAVFAGLVVPPAPFRPASLLNESTFLAVTGLPVQLFDTIPVLVIARGLIRLLRVFEVERRMALDEANRRRLEAQQQALDAQRHAREDMERWSAQLEDVVDTIAVALSQAVNRQEMLDTLLHKIVELARLELGAVFLMGDGAEEPVLAAHCGLCRCGDLGLDRSALFEWLLAKEAKSGELTGLEDRPTDPEAAQKVPEPHGAFLQLGVPLSSRGAVLGMICLAGKDRGPLTVQEQRALVSLGQQIGVGVELSRLHKQVERLATLEERDRLARELHDSLAQELGYLNVQASVTEGLLSAGKIDQARSSLLELREAARESYSGVRGEMSSLRAASMDLPLPDLLERYLSQFRQRFDLEVCVEAESEGLAQLITDAKTQVFRILQEALTNAGRHAEASKVCVRVELEEGCTCISVEDDGRGFEPGRCARAEGTHLGLQVMRERAKSAGCELEIASQPGGGTRVSIRIPVSNGERVM